MKLTPSERKRLLPEIAGCHELEQVNSTGMKINRGRPPNFAAILKVFPRAEGHGVLFAYGDTIFNPSDVNIPLQTIAHECTHRLQQNEIGGPENWWKVYLENPHFRFMQELDAHRIEYRVFCVFCFGSNRAERHRYRRYVSEKLAGPLYNNMISRRKAQQLITLETDHELEHRAAVRAISRDGRAPIGSSVEPSLESQSPAL